MSEQATRPGRSTLALVAAAVVLAGGFIAWKVWDMSVSRAAALDQAFGIDRSDVPAPPLELTTFQGERFSLAQAKGQVVFVNFWATWCPPCVEEMPSMVRLGQALEARHPGKFRMVAVSVDERWDPVAAFFKGPPPPAVTVTLDPEQMTTQAWYCAARGACPDSIKFPETYIVDKSGRLVAYVVGPRNWADPAATAFLERLIED